MATSTAARLIRLESETSRALVYPEQGFQLHAFSAAVGALGGGAASAPVELVFGPGEGRKPPDRRYGNPVMFPSVGVTFGVVGRIDDVADDAQMQAIGALVPFADGKTLTVSSPFHLDGETKVAPRRAPVVGQHSEDVLRDAGYSADDIGRLRELGVLA
jgi:hypothetical protein